MALKRKYFGTDGVRDFANSGLMTCEGALRLGRAYVKASGAHRVVIGRDTRSSGGMLEGALSAALASEGADVYLCGIIPTPGVSYAVRSLGAEGGAVISASHNPAEYNGIKFLGSDGCKLSDEQELNVESFLDAEPNISQAIGQIRRAEDITGEYARHIAGLLASGAAIDALAFDCASGAASVTVPLLTGSSEFHGKNVHIISRDYENVAINAGCGVMHMTNLTEYVKANKLSAGFAFDGDADRVLVCDSKGRVIDGDIILWVLARWLKACEYPGSGKVIATVMSNSALEEHLAQSGIELIRCGVGDRYVLESMRSSGAALGGEQSGHIIASRFTPTGDGLCTAVLFMNAVHDLSEDIDTLIDRFGRYPQELRNVELKRERSAIDMPKIDAIVREYASRLEKGRVYVRLSGTEPLLRILVEAPDACTVKQVSDSLVSRLTEYCE